MLSMKAADDLDSLAAGYVGPLTLGAGQFGTKPGGSCWISKSDH